MKSRLTAGVTPDDHSGGLPGLQLLCYVMLAGGLASQENVYYPEAQPMFSKVPGKVTLEQGYTSSRKSEGGISWW